jgi:gluconate kinase
MAEGAKLDDADRAALIEAMQGALDQAQTEASDGNA